MVERLLEVGIDGRGPVDSAQQLADKARTATPEADGAIDAVVRQHLKIAAAGGFVTGLGGFVTLPVALPGQRGRVLPPGDPHGRLDRLPARL